LVVGKKGAGMGIGVLAIGFQLSARSYWWLCSKRVEDEEF